MVFCFDLIKHVMKMQSWVNIQRIFKEKGMVRNFLRRFSQNEKKFTPQRQITNK